MHRHEISVQRLGLFMLMFVIVIKFAKLRYRLGSRTLVKLSRSTTCAEIDNHSCNKIPCCSATFTVNYF